jgi:hypothetical protein
MRLNWNVISVRLEIVLTLMQDRCTVCAERTIGSEIVLDALMEVLGDKAQVETCFAPFGDDVSVSARMVHDLCNIGSKVVLDAPDGTPM